MLNVGYNQLGFCSKGWIQQLQRRRLVENTYLAYQEWKSGSVFAFLKRRLEHEHRVRIFRRSVSASNEKM
jgi:hypothetical protein